MIYFLLALVIFLMVSVWQITVWLSEDKDKRRKFAEASAFAHEVNKPLLVAGGPWGNRPMRRFFKKPAHGNGDVCLDIDPAAIAGPSNAVVASVTHIPFADKAFAAAFASHLLEHLPSTGDAKQALDELHRIADRVFISYPSRQSIGGWITPGHKLWVWQRGNTTFFKRRHNPGDGKVTDPVLALCYEGLEYNKRMENTGAQRDR
jgi:hypothetical protein